jgi:hypothetical protein
MVALHFMMSGAAVLSSYASPSLASRRDAGVRGKAAWVAAITLFTHLLILAYDHARAFRAFNWGDRGLERLRILKEFAGLKGAVLPAMTGSPIVPGEYLFVLLPWRLWGRRGSSAFRLVWQRWPHGWWRDWRGVCLRGRRRRWLRAGLCFSAAKSFRINS